MLDLVSRTLSRDGYEVITATNGESALTSIRAAYPAMAILDLMMPKLTGLDVCRAVRSDSCTSAIPLIMISARGAEVDRVVAFELGVDDYITKPFSPRELLLRVRAILRHAPQAPAGNGPWTVGAIRLDRETHSASVAGEEVMLTAIEFKLLRVLMQVPERVHSREALLREIWGGDNVGVRTVDTQIRRLRAKLGVAADQLQTVRAFGYRLTSS